MNLSQKNLKYVIKLYIEASPLWIPNAAYYYMVRFFFLGVESRQTAKSLMKPSFPSGSNIDPKRSQNHRGFQKLWLNYLRTALTLVIFI